MLQNLTSKVTLGGTYTLAAPVTKLNMLSHTYDKDTTRQVAQSQDMKLEELGRVP